MPITINGSTGISGTDGSASTPVIQGTDTNTGIYFPGNDRIGFAEGGVQVGEFDANGNFLMNSGYGSVAVAYACRAWVNFNGTGTVAIRASGNVSSITDNGVGDYTVNFTTAMSDANYSLVYSAAPNYGVASSQSFNLFHSAGTASEVAPTTTAARFNTGSTGGYHDSKYVTVAIFR